MLNPELLNKFHQNLRMVQTHSAMGVTEENINLLLSYMEDAYSWLEQANNENEAKKRPLGATE